MKEVRGKLCPFCGGNVVKVGRRWECDWDGYVVPVPDPAELLDADAGMYEPLLPSMTEDVDSEPIGWLVS